MPLSCCLPPGILCVSSRSAQQRLMLHQAESSLHYIFLRGDMGFFGRERGGRWLWRMMSRAPPSSFLPQVLTLILQMLHRYFSKETSWLKKMERACLLFSHHLIPYGPILAGSLNLVPNSLDSSGEKRTWGPLFVPEWGIKWVLMLSRTLNHTSMQITYILKVN